MIKKLRVIKPLRINPYILEIGDEFDVTDWNETSFGIFFRPLNVEGMRKGMGWLFTEKTFEIIE